MFGCDNMRMAWIETIPEGNAQGDLRRSYEAAGMRAGKVWNIVKVMSLSPPTLRASMGLYLSSVQGSSPLTRAQREMLAVVVSKVNNCHY
jgi:alkylhydroperoxidase family enzyme